ncbi:MAG: hypothetical protein NVS1B11_21110 [Terriglobales bacterium]
MECDLNTKAVSIANNGYRQLWPRLAPLYVEPIADEMAQLIADNKIDCRLECKIGTYLAVDDLSDGTIS